MDKLTPAEKASLIRCIQDDLPLPLEYLPKLLPKAAKPQLVWPGKDFGCSISDVEIKLCEFFTPSSQPGKALYETDWHDKLMLGDNLEIMAELATGKLAEAVKKAGGLKLIYIDPPFNAEANFSMTLLSQDSAGSKFQIPVYADKWPDGISGYLSMIYPRLKLMRNLLAENGCIYVHCDWRVSSFLRLILDELFSVHVNEICWHYTGGGRSAKRFSRKHDSLLVYSKTANFPFNPDALRIPYNSTSSYAKSGIRAKSGKKYSPNPLGKLPDDVWDIPIINPLSGERNGYPTQKPEKLLTRILLASSAPGDLVADFFCGSGTLPVVASKLGRKWIAADNSPHAIHVTRKRLLQLADEARNEDAANHAFEIWKSEDSTSSGLSSHLNLSKNHFSDVYEYGIKVEVADDHFTVSLTEISELSTDEEINETVQMLAVNSEKIIFRAGKIFKISRKKSGCLDEILLSDNWTDWIDYWAVDAGYGLVTETDGSSARSIHQLFRTSWHSFRKREGGIDLTSRPLPMPGPGCVISIKIIDILANETIQKLKL